MVGLKEKDDCEILTFDKSTMTDASAIKDGHSLNKGFCKF